MRLSGANQVLPWSLAYRFDLHFFQLQFAGSQVADMAETVTDPLEKAVLSGAIFAGPDPDGPERRANGERDSDHDKASSGNDGEADDDDDDDLDSEYGIVPPSEMPSGGPVRTTKGQSHNTGVKGVLADYRNRNNPQWRQEGNAQSAENDLDESDGEQEAREAYRKQRIQEMMKMGSTERAETIGGPRYRAKFGQLREVGQEQFLKATEAQDGVMVIVHVYSPVSTVLHSMVHHMTYISQSGCSRVQCLRSTPDIPGKKLPSHQIPESPEL